MNIKISDNFRKNTIKTIFSIISFALVYIMLLVLSIGLAASCIYLSFKILTINISLLTIILGIGISGFGISIFIFLFKFFFKQHIVDISDLYEVTREEEPELFSFVEEIVIESNTKFPKKIYLMQGVNAGVFYDSSFWSMLFPVQKNLKIGLGLINTTTKQEFKAILAHEFGHFSQKSMAVGSYVYNINEVIFNMLYDNEDYSVMMSTWASMGNISALTSIISTKIIQGIQWILRKMYNLININYMALSREMEFYADEVAANIASSKALQDSLLRLSFCDDAYNKAIQFYEKNIDANNNDIKSEDIYKEQSFVMLFNAHYKNYLIQNDLPQISIADLNKYNKSKLNIKDQWASHPNTEDRVEALEKLNIIKENIDNRAAKSLFIDFDKQTKNLTRILFHPIKYKGEVVSIDIEKFKELYTTDFNKFAIDKIFNEYYEDKNPECLEINESQNIDKKIEFEDIFSDEKVTLVYELLALEYDKNILTGIVNKEYQIKTFDYDGIRYKAKNIKPLISTLEKSIAQIIDTIKKNDQDILTYFYGLAIEQGKENVIKEKYEHYCKVDKDYKWKYDFYQRFIKALSFIGTETPYDQINANFKNIAENETYLKDGLKYFLSNERMADEIEDVIKENIEEYLSKNWTYFARNIYIEDSLNVLVAALHNYNYLSWLELALAKKDLLEIETDLYKNKRL